MIVDSGFIKIKGHSINFINKTLMKHLFDVRDIHDIINKEGIILMNNDYNLPSKCIKRANRSCS
jgi:hypothetical protein